jgi:hypothetical protein
MRGAVQHSLPELPMYLINNVRWAIFDFTLSNPLDKSY